MHDLDDDMELPQPDPETEDAIRAESNHSPTTCSVPFTPKAHSKHTGGRPCGCWVGNGDPMSCVICGASYEAWEVLGFPVWRCYDCGAGGSPPWKFFKPNAEVTQGR